MSLSRLLFVVVLIVAGVMFVRWGRDPHRTALPFGSTDLSSVQDKLARLPEDERALVEAYVKRSNGDVLLPSMADPDAPFTARTFAEAIKLERDWQARMGIADAHVAELQAQRQARMRPLQELVSASVAKAEIITRNEFQARRDPGFYQRPYQVDTSPTFWISIRIENLSNERIVAMTGSLQARDSESVLPMDLCWIDLGRSQELAPRSSIEINCGNANRGASQQQRDFIDDTAKRFSVEWEPHHITLASGRELDAGL
jgi:hypothetical protein